MAGRRKSRVDHSPVKDLKIQDYEQAWKYTEVGKSQSEICRLVGITGKQYWHMWRHGFPPRGGSPEQASFEWRIAEQAMEARRSGIAAASSIGIRGVRVLSQQLANAETANEIARLLLELQVDRLRTELEKPAEERDAMEDVLLGKPAQSLLRSLQRWADLRVPAGAFHRLYDMRVTDQVALNGELPSDPIDAEAKALMPAALACREEMTGGDERSHELLGAARTLEGWTLEELQRYAETGEEPTGTG